MIYVRWFGVAFGVTALTIQPTYPDTLTEVTAWSFLILLAGGNLVLWWVVSRLSPEADHSKVALAGFLLDSTVIMGFVWVYAYEEPYVTWALLFLVPMDGAMRYRLRGAVMGALLVALFFIPQSLRRAEYTGDPFDYPTYVFLVGFSCLVAGITGSMADSWHEQNLAFREQGLRLAELDQLKDRFLAVTSHEIRGPLTAVLTGMSTLRKHGDRLNPDQKKNMEAMVLSQARQLARLVDDLQITSQLQSGGVALYPQWTDINDAVLQAIDAAASKRRDHQLELFVEPVRSEIDSSRFGQIIRNLVENAYKYTPERTRVGVTCRPTDNGLFLEVADEGPGIPPAKRGQLFEAFSRIEETAAGRDGVGLGLYVVSQLVAAMDGRIDLTSSSEGTAFSIYIPCPVEKQKPKLGIVRPDQASG